MAQELKTDLVTPAPGPSPLPRMTFEEFLEWSDEDTFAEWVDGEVILMSPVSDLHQDLAAFLISLLRHFVEAKQAGRILMAPFLMKLNTRPSGREPDILFVSRRHLDRLKGNYLDGPADLVVEIISPESRKRDRKDKYYEYQQAGIREYWLFDPIRKQVDFYRLNDGGTYEVVPTGEDGIFRSEVLSGLWFKVDWFWQDPLPQLMFVLKEWGLVKK